MRKYDNDIYEYYMGQDIDIDKFIDKLDRNKYHKQLDYYWSKYLNGSIDDKILDLGCGWGDFLLFLKNKGYFNLYGIDASSQQVKIANKLGLSSVICGNLFEYLDKLIEEKEKFMIISALNLLEHLDKDTVIPFLQKVNTLLLSEGSLFLEIPNANSLFGGRTRYWDFTHKTSFTPTSVKQVLNVANFNNIIYQEKTAIPKNMIGIFRLLLWKYIKIKIYISLLVEQGSIGINIFSQDMQVIAKKNK